MSLEIEGLTTGEELSLLNKTQESNVISSRHQETLCSKSLTLENNQLYMLFRIYGDSL